MKPLLSLLLFAFTSSAVAQSSAQPATDNQPLATSSGPWVFAYFKEPGNQGIYFALSRDGYTFTPLNDGQPWLKPTESGEIMRDVYITRTPTGDGFRAVWTWAWRGNSLGTASSPDLLAWSPQTEVTIMKDFPTVRNVWAPETYWDDDAHQWLLIWSSAVDGLTDGNRIWASGTADFITFSKPEIFYDPGFVVIDATMFHRHLNGKNDVVFMVKDQSLDPLRYQERWTSGPTVEGRGGRSPALSTRAGPKAPRSFKSATTRSSTTITTAPRAPATKASKPPTGSTGPPSTTRCTSPTTPSTAASSASPKPKPPASSPATIPNQLQPRPSNHSAFSTARCKLRRCPNPNPS